jgi:hypothetical protein
MMACGNDVKEVLSPIPMARNFMRQDLARLHGK